jgi:hypothetical protein
MVKSTSFTFTFGILPAMHEQFSFTAFNLEDYFKFPFWIILKFHALNQLPLLFVSSLPVPGCARVIGVPLLCPPS